MMAIKSIERQHSIDWLRALAMLTIFLFHCARYFDQMPWHVKNYQQSFGMQVFVGIIVQWIMPLFFILSAMSIYHSLNKRNASQYLGERFKRLIIPFIFGTMIVIVPIQVWIERVTQAGFSGSFFEFYTKEYFNGFYGFGGNFPWMGLHLWYLEFLFLFSLITLPLFLFLLKPAGNALTDRLAEWIKKPGAIFCLAIPIVAIELLVNLRPEDIGSRVMGGWSLFTYLVIFILGFIIMTHRAFLSKIVEVRYIALIIGIISMGGVLFCYMVQSTSIIFYIFRYTLEGFNTWFWLMAILGFGTYYLNFNNQALQYANKAVLPFYILHQAVIVGFGFIMINWSFVIIIKYLFLSLSSFIMIMIIYEFVIKRIKLFRFLFGMKELTKTVT